MLACCCWCIFIIVVSISSPIVCVHSLPSCSHEKYTIPSSSSSSLALFVFYYLLYFKNWQTHNFHLPKVVWCGVRLRCVYWFWGGRLTCYTKYLSCLAQFIPAVFHLVVPVPVLLLLCSKPLRSYAVLFSSIHSTAHIFHTGARIREITRVSRVCCKE